MESLPNIQALQRRVRVALGEEPGDLLLTGGHVVNVFTGRIDPANIVIADGWIAGVGPDEWPALETVSLAGRTILPGLIDAHMHLESTLLLPAELARVIVPHGTTTVIADPHEIGNVAGAEGIEQLIAASADCGLDVFFMAPSCVPASEWESSGAVLDADAVDRLLDNPRVLGLAEMMNFPGVLAGAPEVMRKIALAKRRGLPVDGHAPGLAGRQLSAYAAAGISSDHESTTVEEALAKASLGMLVQVREGSSARNLDTFLPLLSEDLLGDWCLATDDIHVDDLMDKGHIDALLRRLVAAGIPPARAIRHASLIPAKHYGLTDRGAVAPGYRADLFVVEDLTGFAPHLTVQAGLIAARDGCLVDQRSAIKPHKDKQAARVTGGDAETDHATALENTVRISDLDESAFELRITAERCPVIVVAPDSIVTTHESRPVEVDPSTGTWLFDPQEDVCLGACVERHRASGRVGLGLIRGFGFRRHGAMGSSVAHDAHNLVIVGTNSRDMLTCAMALRDAGGGLVAVSDGSVSALLPLDVGGLISSAEFRSVRRQLDDVTQAARDLGCRLPAPFGTLSFLCLSVIPELRLTDRGVFDVLGRRIVAF